MNLASKSSTIKFQRALQKMEFVAWGSTTTFQSGAVGEQFVHYVYVDNHLYFCGKSHTKTSYTKTPAQSVTDNDGYWILADELMYAFIQFLVAHQITADMINTAELEVQHLRTAGEGARIEASGSMMSVFGTTAKNIEFGVNEVGYAVLKYFDNDGRMLYDLGPNGITTIPVSEESWTERWVQPLGMNMVDAIIQGDFKSCSYYNSVKVYQYHSKKVAGVVEDQTNDGLFFTSPSKTATKLIGVYTSGVGTTGQIKTFREMRLQNYNGRLLTTSDIPSLSIYNEAVYATAPINFDFLTSYVNGSANNSETVYWNGSTHGGNVAI